MHSEAWRETVGRTARQAHIVDPSDVNSLPTLNDNGLPSREATASHRACIAELLLRFPCPRDTDPEDYAARAELLAQDCASLQSGLLRKACDRAAQSARGLPYAAEILAAAKAIVEERQAAQAATASPESPVDRQAQSLADRNRHLDAAGFRFADGDMHRWALVNGKPELVRCSGKGARARYNGFGQVQLAHWSDRYREWIFDDLEAVQ